MSYNKINLRFTDDFCEYNNKVSSNNFNDEYLTQPIKRIITFNDN